MGIPWYYFCTCPWTLWTSEVDCLPERELSFSLKALWLAWCCYNPPPAAIWLLAQLGLVKQLMSSAEQDVSFTCQLHSSGGMMPLGCCLLALSAGHHPDAGWPGHFLCLITDCYVVSRHCSGCLSLGLAPWSAVPSGHDWILPTLLLLPYLILPPSPPLLKVTTVKMKASLPSQDACLLARVIQLHPSSPASDNPIRVLFSITCLSILSIVCVCVRSRWWVCLSMYMPQDGLPLWWDCMICD